MFVKITAVAGLLLSLLVFGKAQAVEMGVQGQGQVLIFPYYTSREGNQTLISLTNSTPDTKAIKVLVLEGDNGQVVASLNLYLGRFDVWTASISSGQGPDGEEARAITSNDESCVVFGDQENFGLLDLANAATDGGRQSQDRVREGYIQVIEMGVIDGSIAFNAAQFNGQPPVDCQFFVDAWGNVAETESVFRQNPQLQMQPPGGGLSGEALIINVPGARAEAYEAAALDHFYVPDDQNAPSLHTAPEIPAPGLADAFPPVSRSFIPGDNGTELIEDTWDNGMQAVDAVLIADRLRNQFSVERFIGGTTEWVVTLPGKRAHVSQVTEPLPPFTSLFASNDDEVFDCERVQRSIFDRGQQNLLSPINFDPPPFELVDLCYEVNVVTFNNRVEPAGGSSENEAANVVSDLLASRLFVNLDTFRFSNFFIQSLDRESGWGEILFNGRLLMFGREHELINPISNRIYRGLPAVGFAARGADNQALNALFGIGVEHTYVREVQEP